MVFEAFSEGQNQGIISAGWVFDRSVVKGAMTQLVAPITDDLSDMKRMRKEARPSVCSSAGACWCLAKVFFDDGDVFFFEGFGEVGGFAAISYEIYKLTCCFAVAKNILARGFSVTWMRVNDLLWRLSKQSAFGGCVLLESEGVVGPYLP